MTAPRQSNRGFGITFGVVFLIFACAIWLIFDTVLEWSVILSALFFAVAMIAPGLLMPLNRIWGVFGARFGWLNNHLILGIFFFFVMTPTAVVMRLFGWDPMRVRSKQKSADGYWVNVRRDAEPDTFRDMF